MNNISDSQTSSSSNLSVPNNGEENKKAIEEIQRKLSELSPSLNNSVNLNTIKDLELRVSDLEEKVGKILTILDSRKINK